MAGAPDRALRARSIAVSWAALGYPTRLKMQARDLGAHRPAPAEGSGATVQPHDVVMLLATPGIKA